MDTEELKRLSATPGDTGYNKLAFWMADHAQEIIAAIESMQVENTALKLELEVSRTNQGDTIRDLLRENERLKMELEEAPNERELSSACRLVGLDHETYLRIRTYLPTAFSIITTPAAEQPNDLQAELEEETALRDQFALLLAGVAVGLKGEELPLHRHSYHDLPEVATVMRMERDLLKHQVEELRAKLAELVAAPAQAGEQHPSPSNSGKSERQICLSLKVEWQGREVPGGWKLVPDASNMTDEQAEAIAKVANCCGGIAYDIYRAALDAAPGKGEDNG